MTVRISDITMQLVRDGVAIVPELISGGVIERARRAALTEGRPAGQDGNIRGARRVWRHDLERSPDIAPIIQHPLALGVMDLLLVPGCWHREKHRPCAQANTSALTEITPAHCWHTDGSIRGSLPPGRPRAGEWVVLGAMWALDDFAEDNGATEFRPWTREGIVRAEMPRGSVCLFIGTHVEHRIGANTSGRERVGMHVCYIGTPTGLLIEGNP